MTTVKHTAKLTLSALTASMLLFTTGCATVSGLFDKKKEEVVSSAEKSADAYYQDAQSALDKGQNREAIRQLNNLRTFYPTGPIAQQALLDLIYIGFYFFYGNFVT